MSDYIRKQDVIDLINGLDSLPWEEETEEIVNGLPTLDEKEIIRKAFERVVERLEEDRLNEYSARAEYISGMNGLSKCYCDVRIETIEKAIKIVKEECGINE